MKIAVPSDDQFTISGHFGRTGGFLIFDIENNAIQSVNYLSNHATGHAQGLHLEHHHHDHDHEHEHRHTHGGGHGHGHGDGHHHHGEGHQAHSHAGIFRALEGCSTVIAGGMGRRLLNDFATKNIEAYITREKDARKAVEAYLEGVLAHDESKACNH